jgi:Type I phosphodiesterase / nucleotide pyrophosphatase
MKRLAGLILPLLCLLTGCGRAPDMPANPVLLLCVDGLEPELVQRFLAAGRLPNIARFRNEGCLGSLETLLPTWSPVVWTTIATGQGLREHGINGFLEPTTNLPYTSNARRVPALWNLVSDAGGRVDTIGYWITWPAEAVQGRMVASYAAQAQAQVIWKPGMWRELKRQTHPEELIEEIAPLITFTDDPEAVRAPLQELIGLDREPSPQEEKLLIDLAWTLMGDRSYTAIAESFLSKDPADLTLVYLSLPDVAGHRFWRYLFPDEMGYPVSSEDQAQFGAVIQRCYEETDRQLGRLLACLGPNTNVLLVSDHGMHKDLETWRDPTALTSGHHQTGPSGLFGALGPAFVATGARFAADNPRGLLGDVRGVAPLTLRLLGLNIPEHWAFGKAGNALEEILTPGFQRSHPRRLQPSPDELWREYHPPSLPIDPGAGMNQGFVEAFIKLGYLTTEGRQKELPTPGE